MSDAPRTVSDRRITDGARPRFGKIPAALSYSGLGRSKLYELAGQHPGLFKKSGATTLVDFEVLDRVLDSLPPAAIKPSSSCRA
jgi:hypothetical protein